MEGLHEDLAFGCGAEGRIEGFDLLDGVWFGGVLGIRGHGSRWRGRWRGCGCPMSLGALGQSVSSGNNVVWSWVLGGYCLAKVQA